MTTPSSTVRSGAQTTLIVALIGFWAYAAAKMKFEAHRGTKPEQRERLKEAIPLAGSSGVSEKWYDYCSFVTRSIATSLTIGFSALLVLLFIWAYPAGPGVDVQELLKQWLHGKWKEIARSYPHRELFVWGKFLAVVIPYYSFALIGAYLDFFCPRSVRPFKIQEDYWPSVKDYLRCLPLVLFNTALLVPILYATYPVYTYFAIEPFGPLPPFWILLVQFPVFISTAEVVFYFPHRWLHTKWAFQNIHYLHHEYTAPIALASVYAHPVEFVLSNVVPFVVGPIMCGTHMSVWLLWTIIGTCNTSIGHIGYQLPFLGRRQAHDWHHRAVHLGMYDLGSHLMDNLFGTDENYLESWQSKVDQNYRTPDYPVDKILASQKDDQNAKQLCVSA